MIKTETLKDGALIRHYSDAGVLIRQVETGNLYIEAVDVNTSRYTYKETEQKIESEEIT